MSSATTAPVGSPARMRWALIGLFAAGVATFALLYAPQPLLPEIAGDFGLTPAVATLVLSATTLALAAGVIPVTRLADRLGRQRVMLVALGVSCVLGLLAPLCPDWPLLLAVRTLQGLTLAAVPGTAVAYATEVAGPGRAGVMSGLYIAGTTVGGMAGRVLGGIFGDLGGWRIGIAGVAGVAVVATMLAARSLPADRVATIPREQVAGRSWDARQLRLCLLAFLVMAAFVATYNAITFRLSDPPYRLSQTAIGLIFVAYLAGTFSSAIAGRLADRTSRRAIVAVSLGVLVVGSLGMLAHSLLAVIVALVVLTAGFFGAHGVASGWISAAAPTGHRGLAAARYTICYYLGSTVGGPVGAALYSAHGWGGTTVLVIVLAVLCLVVTATLPAGRTPARSAPARPGG